MSVCPVPISQRPLKEFKQLSESWFFSWPLTQSNKLTRNLFISWVIIYPFILIIETGSYYLKSHPHQLFSLGTFIGLFFPLSLVIRQLIGWNYIFKKLISEKIEYEESGWYDGQTWEKPNDWREKEFLIAQYEVKPIIKSLKNSLIYLLALISILLFYYKLI